MTEGLAGVDWRVAPAGEYRNAVKYKVLEIRLKHFTVPIYKKEALPVNKERTNAAAWLFEKIKIGDEYGWVVGSNLDHSTVPDGLYCYDVFTTGDLDKLESLFIANSSTEENICGTMISLEPIDFEGQSSKCMKDMEYLEDEYLVSIDDIANELEEQTQGMMQMGSM